MLWTIIRILLGIYLLVGFLIYLARARAIEEEAREAAKDGNRKFWAAFTGRIAEAILLWPYVLAAGRYGQ